MTWGTQCDKTVSEVTDSMQYAIRTHITSFYSHNTNNSILSTFAAFSHCRLQCICPLRATVHLLNQKDLFESIPQSLLHYSTFSSPVLSWAFLCELFVNIGLASSKSPHYSHWHTCISLAVTPAVIKHQSFLTLITTMFHQLNARLAWAF